MPDGVFNVVHGDKVAVDAILEHPDIAAVSFVGSTPIARYIYSTGTANGKRVQALGGAKNHMIVLPDADLDMAADAAVSAGYGSAGERCMAISAVVTVGDIGDDFIKAVKERLPKVKVGPGTDPENEMGPLITREHRDKVASYLDSGKEQGAEVVADGRETAPDGDGFFLGVSLLDKVTPEMDAYKDEIFGPVLSVVRAGTYKEAIRLVNENQYGNGVAIFTRDGGVARQFQHEVEVGMVGVNVPIPVPVAYYSFGGWKGSLFGDSHIYGPEGINFYTRGKVVTSRWPDPATSKVDLGIPANEVMDMEMNMVVDRGKSGAERLRETLPPLPPLERFRLRRKSRKDRLVETIQELPPVARIGLAAAAAGVLVGLAYVARRRLFVAAAVVADVIEEAADTVEDAAEDLAEAARERADGDTE